MEFSTATVTSAAALQFSLISKCSTTRARASIMHLPHYSVRLPVFMPVGTQGTMKGLTSNQLRDMDCEILLGNTYHLGHRPGPEILTSQGGLHKFMDWDRAILTDSGGFQMVSLLKLSSVSEEGVQFQSPHNGSQMMLKPEESIRLQNAIGSDIMMQLDDVVNPLSSSDRLEEATKRSIRWLDRCLSANTKPETQALFPIIQGGLDLSRREHCLTEMNARDCVGYAIGGLGGGEEKKEFTSMIKYCTERLSPNKPIYCMGIGYDLDLLVCVALGVDMFDCVFPTRTARFGHALHPCGDMSLKKAIYAHDLRPIDKDCNCLTCKTYSRAALHGIVGKETTGCHLISIHNIVYMLRLSRNMRDAIIADKFPEFIKSFLFRRFISNEEKLEKDPIPQWIIDALATVNVSIDF